jgi:murein DD-endopeptidase MepM/ murein hydrolase activator NlpD
VRKAWWQWSLSGVMAVGVIGAADAASAHVPTDGGTRAPDRPEVSTLQCDDGRQATCPAGRELTIRGERLAGVRRIVFLGTTGRHDDRRSQPIDVRPHRLDVTVPADAESGPLRLVTEDGPSGRAARLEVEPAPAPVVPPTPPSSGPAERAFPVEGRWEFGRSPANGFGGGRGHQGQDIFASCGTPVVASAAGEVIRSRFEGAAGNHVVIARVDGQSDVYMHLRAAAQVSEGQVVEVGQPLGEVGETGRASGCHLHFELWSAPGWYRGGQAVDPLPELQRWAAAS